MTPTKQQRVWMFERMIRSRKFDEAIYSAYMEGKSPAFNMASGPLPGEMHQSFGEEPCGVGVCVHLSADDAVGADHRPHHVAIARDVDLDRMAAEIFGKTVGLSGGRGGHMHLYDKAVNFFCSGIIAEGMGPGAGMALARKLQKRPGIAVSFIGEAAANQGAFHEVMNMASLWKLPYVCVIQDNKYGVSIHKRVSTAVARNSDRASSYNCFGDFVSSNDPDEIFAAAGRAIARARSGEGPTILEIETERLHGHFIGDPALYRPEAERKAQRDPIPIYKRRLQEQGVLSAADIDALDSRIQAQVDRAMRFARESTYPAPEDALSGLYA